MSSENDENKKSDSALRANQAAPKWLREEAEMLKDLLGLQPQNGKDLTPRTRSDDPGPPQSSG